MKKVLIITYYWPPAGGGGIQRVLKFAKYLPKFGWEPVILTVQNPDAPTFDSQLLNEIPKSIKVYHTKSIEPYYFYKKFTNRKVDSLIPNNILVNNDTKSTKEKIAQWIRLNLFIPDAKIGWKYFAVKKGIEIIKKENINVIFTTSPPPTAALIGYKLAKITNLKWVADFRDPWMEIVYYQTVKRSWLTKTIDSKLEKKVLTNADSIITTATSVVDLFKSKVGGNNYNVITNGYDEDNVDSSLPMSENFNISYAGSLSNDRIPYILFPAIKKFVANVTPNIKLNFIGSYSDELVSLIKEYELSSFFNLGKFIPHNESLAVLKKSTILLLVVDKVPNNNVFIPGKMFEYFGVKRPIFAIGPVNGEANRILINADAGKMIDYEDTEGAYQLLVEMYNNWLKNDFNYSFNVKQYTRKQLTEKLSKIFNNYV